MRYVREGDELSKRLSTSCKVSPYSQALHETLQYLANQFHSPTTHPLVRVYSLRAAKCPRSSSHYKSSVRHLHRGSGDFFATRAPSAYATKERGTLYLVTRVRSCSSVHFSTSSSAWYGSSPGMLK